MPEWIGKTIGKVRIDQLLAHGGMAEVYLGTHLTLDRPVAVKVLHSYIEQEPDLRERLEREAKVVASFRHPNIVQVYDFDTIEGHPYIVMEYLNGPTLAVYLRDLSKRNARLAAPQILELLSGPAAALDYAHSLGVIHRDVKPGNIMLHGSADDTSPGKISPLDLNAVMTDFGLLHVAGATHLTSEGAIAGTPNYMSPEQASGSLTDYRTDIYSLGVVLYEMLAGRAPFDGDSSLTVIYKQINEPPPPIQGISPPEQAVMSRALAKKPDDRYQSCAELVQAFEAAISEPAAPATVRAAPPVEAGATVRAPAPEQGATALIEPQHAPVKTSAAPSAPPPIKRPAWIIPAAAGAALALVIATAALFLLPRLSPASLASESTPAATNAVPATGGLPSADGMARIPAGTYRLGMDPPDDFHAAAQNVSLTEYWIDRNLVTNAQYKDYVDQTSDDPPQIWPGDASRPVRGVSWEQADAYCGWLGKRLPTEAEWEAAGRGTNPVQFPWGDDPTDGGKVLQMPDQDTYDVGSLAFNVSSFGVYDLVGNVWQWVGDAYAPVPADTKVLRGGRFGLPQDLAYRVAVASEDPRYVKFAGLRCAAGQTK